MRLLRALWRWLLRAVPSDEALAADTPETRAFRQRIEENAALARRRLAELHTTASPIRRRTP